VLLLPPLPGQSPALLPPLTIPPFKSSSLHCTGYCIFFVHSPFIRSGTYFALSTEFTESCPPPYHFDFLLSFLLKLRLHPPHLRGSEAFRTCFFCKNVSIPSWLGLGRRSLRRLVAIICNLPSCVQSSSPLVSWAAQRLFFPQLYGIGRLSSVVLPSSM